MATKNRKIQIEQTWILNLAKTCYRAAAAARIAQIDLNTKWTPGRDTTLGHHFGK